MRWHGCKVAGAIAGPSREAGKKRQVSALGVDDRIRLSVARQPFCAIFPQRFQGAGGSRVIDLLKKAAQPLSPGAAVLGVDRIIDVDIQLGGEELRETRIREIQHVATPSDYFHEVVNQVQINGKYRANEFLPSGGLVLCVYYFL